MTPVILESPYAAGDNEKNIEYARAAMRDCLFRGEAPFASHLLYTQPGVLRDDVVEERERGIQAGFAWRLAAARAKTVVYTDLGISRGMQLGIGHATVHGLAIEYRTLPGWAQILLVPLLLFLAACDLTLEIASRGGAVTLTGDPADPRSLVVDNGLVTLSFPCLHDSPEPGCQHEQTPVHTLHLGSTLVTNHWYGDGTFPVDGIAPGHEPEVEILRNDDEAVELAFIWRGHRFDRGAPNGCYLGWPCGIVRRDWDGNVMWSRGGDDGDGLTPSDFYITKVVDFYKTVGVFAGEPGYRIGQRFDPMLRQPHTDWNNHENGYGEHEFWGGAFCSVVWSSAGVVARHPAPAGHVWAGIDNPTYLPGVEPDEQEEGPWWMACLGWDQNILRVTELEHRMESGFWKFADAHPYTPTVHFINDELEADGRPRRYQMRSVAAEYTSPDLAAEPCAEAQEIVESLLAETWEP